MEFDVDRKRVLHICWMVFFVVFGHAEGTRQALRAGTLTVPGDMKFSEGTADLVLHLHGAVGVVERNLARSRHEAVLVNVTLPGLSSVYRRHFEDSSTFPELMREVGEKLAIINGGEEVQVRHLTLMSFSAGFGGVRELLKQPKAVERIDALVMADSLYAGFTGNSSDRSLNPDHLAPFLQYARMAADGRKQMVLSHTQLFTPEYASTKETADYLIQGIGGRRIQETKILAAELTELYRFKKGGLLIIGFQGETGEDHMNHLKSIRLFLDEVQPVNGTVPR